MGMSGKFNGLKPPSFKPAWNSALMQDNGVDGVCAFCNRWAAELGKDHMCREEDCRHGRMLVALAEGRAAIKITRE
jgi:hypothetical protein